jgi:hypothetical protein
MGVSQRILILLLLAASACVAGFACSCDPPRDDLETLSSGQIIFVGEVVESHAASWWVRLNEYLGSFTPFGFKGVDRVSLVRVLEPIKGKTDSRLWFAWFDGCCPCDIALSKGKTVLIVADPPPPGGPWVANICSGSIALESTRAEARLQGLRSLVRKTRRGNAGKQ